LHISGYRPGFEKNLFCFEHLVLYITFEYKMNHQFFSIDDCSFKTSRVAQNFAALDAATLTELFLNSH
jgi:hypothetical protein